MNPEKLNQLFELATGSSKQTATPKAVVKTRSQDNAKKVKAKYGSYKGTYTSPAEAWATWYENSMSNIDSDNADDIWSFAEQNHPQGKDAARDYLRRKVEPTNDPFVDETTLRNQMTKAPSWFVEENMPKLNQLGATVSNQNLVKARRIYSESFKKNLQKLDLGGLDPDVPLEVHINDLVKIEMMGSTEMASVVNGRLAVATQDGNIQPAFMIDQPQDLSTDSELGLISQIVPAIAEPIMKLAMKNAVDLQAMDNRMASGATAKMLKDGLPVEQWGDAFSILGNNDIETALGGAAVKDDLGYEELLRLTAEANTMYGGQQ